MIVIPDVDVHTKTRNHWKTPKNASNTTENQTYTKHRNVRRGGPVFIFNLPGGDIRIHVPLRHCCGQDWQPQFCAEAQFRLNM